MKAASFALKAGASENEGLGRLLAQAEQINEAETARAMCFTDKLPMVLK